MIKMGLKEKIKNFDWRGHLVDTTAINAFAVPVAAVMETSGKLCELMNKIPYVDVIPITGDVSLKARLTIAGLGYVGLAKLLTLGRDFSKKIFKIKDSTKESLQWAHDTAYLVAFNAVVNPTLYTLMGERDPKKIIGGTLALSVFSVFAGGPIGYTIDSFEDLMGLKTCNRRSYSDLIRRQTSKFKKGLAALLVAGSIAVTAGIYSSIPNKKNSHLEDISTKQVETYENNNSIGSLEYKIGY